MSLATWKKEFYPITAIKAATSDKRAIEHSLRKWRGLRKGALKRHGVEANGFMAQIEDQNHLLPITIETCALCALHYCYGSDCSGCPLLKVLGKRCDSGDESPFKWWADNHDPVPMIKALEKARKLVGK